AGARLVSDLRHTGGRLAGEGRARGVEPESAIPGSRQRPLLLGAFSRDSRAFTNSQSDRRPGRNLSAPLFQEVIEELGLAAPALRAIVVSPLLLPMNLEPLLPACDPLEHLQRTPGVQSLVGPACDDVGRR